MSAVNIFLTPDRALIFTDASVYDAEGYLTALVDKARIVTGSQLVVTGSGNAWFPEMVAEVLEEAGFSIDDVATDAGSVLDECYRIAKPQMDRAGKDLNRIYVVGWSTAHRRPLLLTWDNSVQGEKRFAPSDLVASPGPDAEAAAAIRREMGAMNRATVDFERLGLATMKAQRFMRGKAEFKSAPHFYVGGHVQRTDLTASGIAKQIVHIWPEDEIGMRIEPRPQLDPVSHANVTPIATMNRAERRRLDKIQRKGAT